MASRKKMTRLGMQHSPADALMQHEDIRAQNREDANPTGAWPAEVDPGERDTNREGGDATAGSDSQPGPWHLATLELGLFNGAVRVPMEGQEPDRDWDHEWRTAEGIGVLGNGVYALLRTHWSLADKRCNLLRRFADGTVWSEEILVTEDNHLQVGERRAWNPTALPAHYWAPLELARRPAMATEEDARRFMERLGLLRGYAEQLWIRIVTQVPSHGRDDLIRRYRIAQALNNKWTKGRVFSKTAWKAEEKRDMAMSVYTTLFMEQLATGEYCGGFWSEAVGDGQEMVFQLGDTVGLSEVLEEVIELCGQVGDGVVELLCEWGIPERRVLEGDGGHDPSSADRPLGSISPQSLSHAAARPAVGGVPSGAAYEGGAELSASSHASVDGITRHLNPSSELSVDKGWDRPWTSSPSHTVGVADASCHDGEKALSRDDGEYRLTKMIQDAVAKQLGAATSTSTRALFCDYDDQDLQQAPDKVRQGLQLLQDIGGFVPRKPDTKPPLVSGVPVYAHKQGNPQDATGNIIKHLNAYDLQATRVNASYAERARDLNMGAFLSDSVKDMHRAMRNTLQVYQHPFKPRERETQLMCDKREYQCAIRLMLLTFYSHKPEFRLLQEIQAVTLEAPTAVDFMVFVNRVFQLYAQLSMNQRTRGQYYNAIWAGLTKCTVEAFKYTGAYWAGRFRDRYMTQSELSKTDIVRR